MPTNLQKYLFGSWYRSLTGVMVLVAFLNLAQSATFLDAFFAESERTFPAISATDDHSEHLLLIEISEVEEVEEVEENEDKKNKPTLKAPFLVGTLLFLSVAPPDFVQRAFNAFLAYPALYIRYHSLKIPCQI